MDLTFIIYTPQAVRILLSSVPLVPSAAVVPATAVPSMVRTGRWWAYWLQGSASPSEATQALGVCSPSWEPRRGLCSTGQVNLLSPETTSKPRCSTRSHTSAAAASPEGLSDMQTLQPHLTPAGSESASWQHPQGLPVHVRV